MTLPLALGVEESIGLAYHPRSARGYGGLFQGYVNCGPTGWIVRVEYLPESNTIPLRYLGATMYLHEQN